MPSLISSALYRYSRWRNDRRDPLRSIIADSAEKISSARKSHKACAPFINAIRNARTERLREQFGAAKEGAALAVMVGGWLAIWIATPGDAMASELSPWNRTTLAETAGIIVIGWIVVVWFIVAAWSRFKDRADPRPKDRDDPINSRDFETTEDRFRRAYAESDGDHASYVKWRRK